jgi:hypothetical protein
LPGEAGAELVEPGDGVLHHPDNVTGGWKWEVGGWKWDIRIMYK